MKKLMVLALLAFLSVAFVKAQSSFEYSYDAAGNRIQRRVITLNPPREGQVIEKITDRQANYAFEIFPNPTLGEITIHTEESFLTLADKRGVIYDLNGNMIKEFQVTSNEIPINLAEQTAGTYIVKITARGFTGEWKVVKL